VDLHHRRADAHARNDAFVGKLELTGIMRHVRRSAAHVEANQALVSVGRARSDHSDDASCGSGEDRILAAEGCRLGKAAVRLHEMEVGFVRQPLGDAVNITSKHGRQICVDDGRIAPSNELDQRCNLVADRDLAEPQLAGDLGKARLVLGITPAVHQDDRKSIDPRVSNGLERFPCLRFIERHQDVAVHADAFIHFDHSLVEHRGKHNVPGENVGTCLVADPQRIPEPARDRHCKPLALSLKECIGGDRRPHPHLGDVAAVFLEDAPDRLQRSVLILAGILRQQFLDP